MSGVYSAISTVWSQFPIEFEMSTFNDYIKTWKAKYENRAYLFDKYITKIIIIGNVSTGKSTLINAILGKNYVGAKAGHGTKSFYYCSLSEKGYEYFTMNNSNNEITEINALTNASYFSGNRSDDINQKTIIKLYVEHDRSKILERKTVIVDCPGFRHGHEYEKEIEKHCSNSDLFIFMFQIKETATEKQINYIKEIRKKYNPTCWLVYNKCNLPEFDDKLKITLLDELRDLFGKEDTKELKLKDSLYFISAEEPQKFADFDRLKTDIMIYKDTNFIRFSNFQSKITDDANEFCTRLNNFVSNEKRKTTSLFIKIDELVRQRENNYIRINSYVERCINGCQTNLQIEKIIDIIFKVIDDYNETCYKEHVSQMIRAIEETVSRKVMEFVENYLIHSCIDQINNKITQINNNNTNMVMIVNDTYFQISTNLLIVPTYRNIEKIFWFFEFGNKTKKIKDHYTTFIESTSVKERIKSSIKNLYENEFSNIRRKYENLLESYTMDCDTKENVLKENLRNLDLDREKLAAYEIQIKENFEILTSSINQNRNTPE